MKSLCIRIEHGTTYPLEAITIVSVYKINSKHPCMLKKKHNKVRATICVYLFAICGHANI